MCYIIFAVQTSYEYNLFYYHIYNEQQEAREALIASVDYQHPVDHALVRSARLARLSGDS